MRRPGAETWEFGTACIVTLLNVTEAMSAGWGRESSTETATTRARSAPLPITCIQDNERVLCLATVELELSSVIEAQAVEAGTSRARTRKARSVVQNQIGRAHV